MRTLSICVACVVITLGAPPPTHSQSPAPKFLSVDAEPETVDGVAKDLQKIVVLCATDPASPGAGDLVRLMAVDKETGEQAGLVVNEYPPNPIQPPDPCVPRVREHILLSRQVGVPAVMVVTADMIIQTAPILFDRFGQISLGEWTEHAPPDDPCQTGAVTAVCEMRPEKQPDGEWRLWLGTEDGFLVEVGMNPDGDMVALGRYPVAVPPNPVFPVSHLDLIPQMDYTALGIGFGDGIRGARLPSGGAPAEEFTLRYPEPGPPGMPQYSHFYPPDPILPTPLVLANAANGTIDVAYVPSNASGEITLAPMSLPSYLVPEVSDEVVVGSLVMLSVSDTSVYYDPGFTDSTGFSGCIVEVSNGSSNECVWCCNTPGDFDNSDAFNIADVTAGIAFIFSGGAAADCQDEADFNGDNSFNIADVTAGIGFIFSAGAPPVCGMTGT
ncbi:MAG TPA: hypothetical protein VLB27_12175 [candidate division Zixibacteria bacterium]|nr:hypothetical protein [candidate division Zixibacteria bacterium]